MIRAYCYPTGAIEFGNQIPAGAVVIARGPHDELLAFLNAHARHCYRVRHIPRRDRPWRRLPKQADNDTLLVPGMPEAPNQIAAAEARRRWCKWIATTAPKGVRVLQS